MALWQLNKQKGMSLVEVLVAIGIFLIVATAGVGTFITSARLQEQAAERKSAYQYAASGLEAVRNIKDEDFALLETGSHGVELTNDGWELQGNGNEKDGYQREIIISSIEDEVVEVSSLVTWTSRWGDREVLLTTQFTDWEKRSEMALDASVDISGAYIFGKGSKNLQGITIENIGSSDVTLDTITISWTPDTNRKINAITIDGVVVWSNSGPGTPSGNQPPGTEIDIIDVILPVGSGPIDINSFDFNGNMKDNVFNITFTMIDGSEFTISNIVPPLI